ncbi:MAG TPA: metal ABC transporter substrate-binding protein [Candidatus Kapabacteria bacterium]|nr:metal ABC transporter substrate-binding protein [Candidatus Kapabacteria bacterium]HPO62090.1 metal ABC transporter substrate-binding protein [Candidatus Kapabacteria bacterium]
MRTFGIITILFLLITNCSSQYSNPIFVTTNFPTQYILEHIVGTKGKVINIVPQGASPHTYSPKPTDISRVQVSNCLFYVSPLLDAWAEKLPAKSFIKIIDFVPKENLLYYDEDLNSGHTHSEECEHNSGDIDPHFWTDPLSVKAMLPKLVDTICALDPENSNSYRVNAAAFEKRLDLLNRQIEVMLKDVVGENVLLFHPSFRYMLKRYNLNYAGAIELSPGKEASPRYLANLIEKIKKSGTKAIFSEPQLPDKPAKVISEATGLNIFILDPNGGIEGRNSYWDLILYNARTLKQALEK